MTPDNKQRRDTLIHKDKFKKVYHSFVRVEKVINKWYSKAPIEDDIS